MFQVNGSLLVAPPLPPSGSRCPRFPRLRSRLMVEGATTLRSREPGPLWFRLQAPRALLCSCAAEALPTGPEEALSGLEHLVSRRSVPGTSHPWARAGTLRFPGDPSYAFALLRDPGRADKTSPFVVFADTAPGLPKPKASAWHIVSRLTQGFSARCLRFTSAVAVAHARLASGRRAPPLLPGRGSNPLGSLQKGFRLHPILLSRTSPVARVVYKPSGLSPGRHRSLEHVGRGIPTASPSPTIAWVSMDNGRVRFRWKDYRRPQSPEDHDPGCQ